MENCTERYTTKNPRLLIRKNLHACLYRILHSHLYANAHSAIRARGTLRYTLYCTPPYTLQCTRTYTHDARAHIRHNARTPIHVILHAGLYANFCTRIYTLYVRLYVKNCTYAYTLFFLASCFSWAWFLAENAGRPGRIDSGGLATTPAARRRPASDFSGGVLILIPGQAQHWQRIPHQDGAKYIELYLKMLKSFKTS